jgi:hypothetical protein
MWPYIAVMVVSVILSLVLAPKPKQQDASAADLQGIDAPTAEEGRPIPVLFGTRDIKNQNVVWYGDFGTQAVQKKGGKK